MHGCTTICVGTTVVGYNPSSRDRRWLATTTGGSLYLSGYICRKIYDKQCFIWCWSCVWEGTGPKEMFDPLCPSVHFAAHVQLGVAAEQVLERVTRFRLLLVYGDLLSQFFSYTSLFGECACDWWRSRPYKIIIAADFEMWASVLSEYKYVLFMYFDFASRWARSIRCLNAHWTSIRLCWTLPKSFSTMKVGTFSFKAVAPKMFTCLFVIVHQSLVGTP